MNLERVARAFRERCGHQCIVRIDHFPLGARVVVRNPNSMQSVDDALREAAAGIPQEFLLTAVVWKPWYTRLWRWLVRKLGAR